MECREVREYLPAYAEQAGGPRALDVDEHLRTCADCRVVLEQYREIALALGSLSEKAVEPPAWLLGTLTETVSERVSQVAAIRARRDRLADPKVVATGGAVIAAGVAGALLLRGMRRRRRSMRQRLREALAQA